MLSTSNCLTAELQRFLAESNDEINMCLDGDSFNASKLHLRLLSFLPGHVRRKTCPVRSEAVSANVVTQAKTGCTRLPLFVSSQKELCGAPQVATAWPPETHRWRFHVQETWEDGDAPKR